MKHLIFVIFATIISVCTCSSCPQDGKSPTIRTVNTNEFASIIRDDHTAILDVRTAKEYASGHIANAINIDINQPDFLKRCKDLPKHVAVYCRSGKRSLKAAQLLSQHGHTVYNLDGGILAWQKATLPIVQ